MPGFASWAQNNASAVVVGKGGYASSNAKAHLDYISRQDHKLASI